MTQDATKHTADTPLTRALVMIERGVENAVSDLARMIAVDTSFPPGLGYDAFADLMEELISTMDFATERVVVPDSLWYVEGGPAMGQRTNLVATHRTGKPVCGLYFHVDTVPAAPGWKTRPLSLTRDGDQLTGLGAADMKGSIAAVLLALRCAAKANVPLAYDPMLLLCTDEEGGLYPGVRYLAEQSRLEGHIINFNGSADARVWAGCFGLFNLLIRVHGQTTHAGEGNRTGAGLNAIEGALPLLQALADLKLLVAGRISALPPPPHSKGPLRAQLSVAAVHGGTCGGQVPSLLEITVNRRYAPEEDFTQARQEIESAVRNAMASDNAIAIDIELIGHLIPTGDPVGPHWPRWQRAFGHGFGYKQADFRRWGAASCSDFGYVQRSGMQEVLLGGLGRPSRMVHSPGEHTTTRDLISLARSVLTYLSAEFEPTLIPEPSGS
jgi:succinyl-diaminopimelate desuccinylase